MNFLDLVSQRYSVRGYENKPISSSDLEYILESVRLSPSACNRQPWHFYVCKSEESLNKVRQCYDRDWFGTAPLVIVCAIRHDEEWVRPNDGHVHGIVDVSIAAEHICLSATERGLGTCWVCNFNAQLCHDLLNLPENEEAAVMIPVGYPTTTATPKKRKEMNQIVTEI
ncbi:MAG: nitroreductase family protein [Bacteroidales bacterium]|nr:nitroreductase family protein [Bacteroidales bacterium]